MKQLEARRLNEFFNTFVRSERDKKKSNYDAQIVVEVTGPEFVGGATRDSNGDNLTMQLLTKSYTTENVVFVTSQRSNLVEIYFQVDAHERGDKHKSVLVVFKNSKGQRKACSVPKIHYGEEKQALDTVRHALGFGFESQMSDTLKDLSQSISHDLFYSSYIKKENREALESLGVRIETVMEYSHRFWINPKFIKKSKNSVTIGWMSFGTYSSHPMLMKISKQVKGISLVRLADIGAEGPGYYSHHNKHTCRPEHAPALKSFSKKFKTLSRKAI